MKEVYRHFGVMLDCSRNAVMKVSEVKHMIDLLEKMGYNTLELYTEDTLEIKDEPFFGYLRGRYTAAEIKEIDTYAKAHKIELIPCIQTLAHFTNLVKLPKYQNIVDINDILLIDEPRTYELIENIFKTLAENFTSRKVNIGMDEANMLGLGRYLRTHGYKDQTELFCRHLDRVVQIAKKYGFTPHMWGDLFFTLANGGYAETDATADEAMKKAVPENVEIVRWDYAPREQRYHDVRFKELQSFDREVWFAGGAWCWVGFAPFNDFSMRALESSMRSVRENGIKDVLITMWGDDGKECSFYSMLPTLYAARQYALGNFDAKKIEDGFYKTFKVKFSDFMLLDKPNDIGRRTYNFVGMEFPQCPCKSLLYNDVFLGYIDHAVRTEKPIPYAEIADNLKKAAKKAKDFDYIFDTLSKLCSVLAIKAELGVRTRRMYQAKDKKGLSSIVKEYDELVKRLDVFIAAYRDLWHRENKPHGWEIQDARLGGVIQRVKTCALRLREYLKGKTERIEELEETILEYEDRLCFYYPLYKGVISTSQM